MVMGKITKKLKNKNCNVAFQKPTVTVSTVDEQHRDGQQAPC